MSDTPKTNLAAFYADEAVNKTTECVHVDFARQLERSLQSAEAAKREALEALREFLLIPERMEACIPVMLAQNNARALLARHAPAWEQGKIL